MQFWVKKYPPMDNMISYTPSRGVVVVVVVIDVDKTMAFCKAWLPAILSKDTMPDCFFIGTNIG
jgi:hypothetical protein